MLRFHYTLILFLNLGLFVSHINGQSKEIAALTSFVNPFIGTGGHGHTYPGATTPFGMVQLSPDTRLTGWDGCSAYHYSDDYIYGFSHTHLSGTGVSDYGDILFMPLNKEVVWNNGADGQEGYRSPFSHDSESASPGFYKVYLDESNVRVELSATPRGGIHSYVFDNPDQPSVLIDLVHRDDVLSSSIRIVSPTRIEGHRRSSAWAKDQHVYFVAEFSEPFIAHTIFYGDQELNINSAIGAQIKASFDFVKDLKHLEVKVAISAVDIAGAWKNFHAELNDVSFDEIKIQAEKSWNAALNKINTEFVNKDDKIIFYSSLYHTMLAPNLYMDVDGRYRDMDLNIYQSDNHTHYTVFSLWDTYRAAHPLYTIIDQKRTTEFIKTLLKKHESGGILPIWDLSACYTGCMIGNHAVPVIADAYIKGIKGYDESAALTAMVHATVQDRLGLNEYKNKGFISVENEAESVSKTLEYAYDDFCVAVMAKQLGKNELHQAYADRSLNYRNVFDRHSGFFRGRMRNTWQSPFDPYEVNNNYTEANAWQYAFYAPHDMEGFIALHGGKEMLDQRLDNLFNAEANASGRDQADITGLIGQYAHGNEPSHHIAYLYNFLNKPWKSQARAREIMSTMYQNQPDGISGNEDCGQMSAWYIFSALGFYPVTPGTLDYIIGSPLVSSATINLESGKQFKITTANQSAENIYIQSATLNGQSFSKSFLSHGDIMKGGTLHFAMGPMPNKNWGSAEDEIPQTAVNSATFIAPPIITHGNTTFIKPINISLESIEQDARIYYSFDGKAYQKYHEPITVAANCRIYTFSVRGSLHSDTLFTDFYKLDEGRSITLMSEYARQYHAGGDYALIDGLRGTDEYRTGVWQGYEGQNLECVVDLGSVKATKNIACGFLQDQNSWIFMPSKVEFFTSVDGINFESAGVIKTETPQQKDGKIIEYFSIDKALSTRYIKMKAHSLIKCPAWHKGYEYRGDCWIFADEIIVE